MSFILDTSTPAAPYIVNAWRRAHPEQDIPEGHVSIRPQAGVEAKTASKTG
ncbi:hypothetical protein GCM10009789_39020 [Kribbella sancticallisti]|uniref:Uncharacterized protein n=1 Tax=Kribbella sancticallisti TaxID=460087 RepID=A0ABP4PK80_9ACTN